jgi:uncharacterized membrane protein
MMGVDSGLLVLGALACGLGLPLLLLAGGWMILRGTRGDRPDAPSARALLERRLAAGEIDVEEYYERESALRSAQVPAKRRGRRRP